MPTPPTGPTAPDDRDPVDPAEPVEPVDPAEPVEPVDPADSGRGEQSTGESTGHRHAAASGDDTGRDRLLTSLMRPSRAQAVVAVLLAVVGFAAVTQVRSADQATDYDGLREQDLIEVFSGLTGAAERARGEIDRLEQTQRDLETETRSRAAALDEAQSRLQTLNVLAGLVPVRGPGIRITVTETEGRVRVGSLLDVVQELRTAGAEAMEFNNSVRVGTESSFQDAVGGIELDGQQLTSPYVIEAIGEPRTLNTGLNFTSGPVEKLEVNDGASVQVDELDTIEITSVREPQRPGSATPDLGD